MRILTGKLKGRNIKMPKGIRPTQNLVRKAVFDILGDIEGLSFLELYAGSAAVGIEALSRGARGLTLIENNRGCIIAIERNIKALKLENCFLLQKDAQEGIKWLKKGGKLFDLIFLDPPYDNGQATPNPKGWIGVPLSAAKKTLQTLAAYDILSPCAFIIIQHFKRDSLPDALGALCLFKQKAYGDTALSFYRKI